METLLPSNVSLDCVDRLFYHQELTKPDYLPILGSSAIEQILSPTPSESSCSSSTSGFSEMERMSPDSTMNPMLAITSNTHGQGTNYSMVSSQQQPDSTTHDLSSYDSDAFDSEDSVSSFAEVQEAAAAANAALLWPKQLNQDEVDRRGRRSISSSSSSSYSDRGAPLTFSNILSNKVIGQAKPPKRRKTKRAEEIILSCQMCDYTTRYKEHLTSHMHTHAADRNYMCSDCGQTFKWSHSLKRHQRTHQTHPDYRYTCNFCFKTFSRKDHLTIHEDLHTTSGETFPCGQCGATFKNRKTLTGHLKTHTRQKDFKCEECDSQFTRRASLNRHVQAAHAGQVITCPLCPAVFSYRSTLEDHKKAAHNEGKREFGCPLCGVQFAVKAYLSKHMVTCRNRAVGRSYECSFCSKSFPTKRHLNEHSKRKHPTIVTQQMAAPVKIEDSSPRMSLSNVAPQPLSNVAPQTLSNVAPQVSGLEVESQSSKYLTGVPKSESEYLFLEISAHSQQSENAMLQLPCPTVDSNIMNTNTAFHQPESANQIQNCYMYNNQNPQVQARNNLPMMTHTNNNNHCSAEEENVGSLLRLVYSCPDQIMEHDANSYVVSDHNSQYYSQHQQLTNLQPQMFGSGKQSSSADNILDYPVLLDGIALDYM